MFGRTDPGACPICGAAHCACSVGTVAIQQLPASAAQASAGAAGALGVPPADAPRAADPAPLLAEQIQATLPPGQFTTGTYRGKKGARKTR